MKLREYMARKLKEARNLAGISAEAAAASVGRSDKTIYAWENGGSEPSAEQMIALCNLYGVEPSFFYPPETARFFENFTEPLSADERVLVDVYRSLGERDRNVLMATAMALAE
jgi:transcriptional regulator with XRE-family HTH domain